MSRVFHLLFHSNVHHRMILSIWLFVYYYETFLYKQSIDQNRLIILLKFLEIELNRHPDYYGNELIWLKTDFLNTFTKLTDRLDEEIFSLVTPSPTIN